MAIDSLKIYMRLTKNLLAEKAQLESRLAELTEALAEGDSIPARKTSKISTVKKFTNSISLREAVVKATTGKPLTKDEILVQVEKLGYRFNTGNPKNSLGVLLYTSKNPKFKNQEGKFSPQ